MISTNSNHSYFKTFRIESLSDGVFAIAMTLLILEIKIPSPIQIHNDIDFVNYLSSMNHHIYSYVLSFVTLGIYWIGHHRQFLFIKHSDRVLLWINVFFLMSVSMVPFSTGLLGQYSHLKSVVVVYGANISVIGLLLWLNWEYSYRSSLMTNDNVDEHTFKSIRIRTLIAPLFYSVGIAFAFYDTNISLTIYAIVQLIYIFPFKVAKNL